MKKAKMILFCVLAVTAMIASTLSVFAAEKKETEYIRCAAIGSAGEEKFESFRLPSDAKKLSSDEKVPFSMGSKGDTMRKFGEDTYFQATLPYAIDYMSLLFDLEGEADDADDQGKENKNDKADNSEENEEQSGTKIDNVFAIGVYVCGNNPAMAPKFDASLTFTDSEGKKYVCSTTLRMGTAYVIYADMSPYSDILFEKAELIITHDKSANEDLTVTVSVPSSCDSINLGFLQQSKLLSLTSHEGELTIEGDLLTLGTDKSDVMLDILPEGNEGEGSHVVYTSFECVSGEGTVAAITDDNGHLDRLHSIFYGSGLTLVRTVRNNDAPLTYRFRSGNDEKLAVKKIGVTTTDETDSMPGSFTTLTYKDGTISAIGKLSSAAVSTYPHGTIGLYTSPVNTKEEPILLDEIKMTSRFSFTVSLEKYPHAHTDNTFFVAVIDGEDVIPVTKKRFVSANSGAIPDSGVLALHGANPISVFESGVTHILIDVDLSRLITNASASSTTVSRGGYIYGIDAEYLRQLDSDISFYNSIGVSVYVKYICTKSIHSSIDGSWLTYDGISDGELMLRADNRESLNMYPAVTSFLSQRYSNIASFVISSGVNSKGTTGIYYRDIWDSVSDVTLIARLVYSSASEFIPNVSITIPLALSGNGIYAPAETFAVLFGEKLLSMGEIPWSVMYCAESDSPSVLCENMKSTARTNNVSSPLYFSVFYRAKDSDGDSTDAYEKYCDTCESSSVKLVFLSVENLTDGLSRESFSELKNYGDRKDSLLYNSNALSSESLDGGSITGTASLWDFTGTYSPEGWNAGYGMMSLQSSPVYGESPHRTLRCITDGTLPAGIFLCSFKGAISLADAPLAEFVFDLEAEDGTQIIFVFGSASQRAEFSVNDADTYRGSDGMLHAVCDLSEYEAKSSIGYVAVIIYSPKSVTLELSKVNIHSKSLDDSAVAELLTRKAEENESSSLSAEVKVTMVLAGLGLFLVSLRIVTLLSKHDAKNKSEAKPPKRRRF